MKKLVAYRSDINILIIALPILKDDPFSSIVMPDVLTAAFEADQSKVISVELEDHYLTQLDESVDELLAAVKLTPNLRACLGNIKNAITRAK